MNNTSSPIHITEDQFVALLRDCDMTQAQMTRFHHLFEQRHPAEHAVFLSGLGLDAATIDSIRTRSR